MHDSSDMSSLLQGLAGAPGRAVGTAMPWARTVAAAPALADPALTPLDRLRQAFAAAEARLMEALATADATLAPLLEAQRLMLDDPEFRDGATALVTTGLDPVTAVQHVAAQLAEILEGAGSEYFRERAIDVRAVGKLVAEALTGNVPVAIPPGAVVLAEELAPLDTARLAEAGVAALVTITGGPTSHAAIMARAWGIPAVVGAPHAILAIPAGTPVLVDGTAGRVYVNPTAEEVAATITELPTVQISRRVPVYANIGSVEEARKAVARGAEGVGLLRTEFLFQDRQTPPSEDEQTDAYAEIVRTLNGRTLIIRTLDIGADKPVPFLSLPPESNPQLGLRGVRLCLRQTDLFRTQLRALLRAATAGPLKIMVPMVASPDEMCAVRDLLCREAADLGVTVPPLGAMIEVPMAALAAPEMAQVCDFFSLGTNDLMQFLLAADRQHAGVGYLHAADHPAVWRLVESVITEAHGAGIPVGVCGEWGSDPEKLPRLLDLGVDSISVAVGALPRVLKMFTAP